MRIPEIIDRHYLTVVASSDPAYEQAAAGYAAVQKAATSDAEWSSAWLKYEYQKLKRCCLVSRLSEQHQEVLREELTQWAASWQMANRLHSAFLERAPRNGLVPDRDFDQWFRAITVQVERGEFSSPEETLYRRYFLQLNGLVPNVGYCRCFAAYLPRSIPERQEELARIGLAMAQIFYLEQLGKQLESIAAGRQKTVNALDLARVSLYRQIAEEMIEGRF